MDKADPAGLVPQWLSDDPWYEAIYRGSMGLDFLPFGESGPAIDKFASLAEMTRLVRKGYFQIGPTKRLQSNL